MFGHREQLSAAGEKPTVGQFHGYWQISSREQSRNRPNFEEAEVPVVGLGPLNSVIANGGQRSRRSPASARSLCLPAWAGVTRIDWLSFPRGRSRSSATPAAVHNEVRDVILRDGDPLCVRRISASPGLSDHSRSRRLDSRAPNMDRPPGDRWRSVRAESNLRRHRICGKLHHISYDDARSQLNLRIKNAFIRTTPICSCHVRWLVRPFRYLPAGRGMYSRGL